MSQKKINNILNEFGLSDKETEVYVFLAKHGILGAGKIAKKTKIARSVVYRILRRLQKKGLVESTLESPTRFIALPFDKALDLIIKKKEDEALQIRKTRKVLLEDWQRISEPAAELELEKFIVVEGKKKIYQKIIQMVNETNSQFCVILPISDLVRAEQFGVFDAASNHPFKSNIQFNFITELSHDNLKAVKLLKPKLGQEIHLKAKQASFGSVVLPRIAIKDEKEIFFFTRPSIDSLGRKQDEVCIYTNCVSLVQTFKGIFHSLWNASTEIEENIVAIETGKYPKVEPLVDERVAHKPVGAVERVETSVTQELDQEKILAARLASTIKLLREEEKDILECAAIIGEEFSVQIMEKISGFKRLKLLKTLIKIEKYELIKAVGEDYRFSNPTTRELIYNQIDPKLRKEYHSLVAEQLENIYKNGFEDVLEKLAHHYFFSRNVKKSVPLLMKAGENAWNQKFRSNKIQDAFIYYSNAIEVMGNIKDYEEVRAKALEKLGDLHSIIIQHDMANGFYEKGIACTNDDALKDRIRKKIRKKKIVEKDGVRLAYFVYGEGEQTLFFVGNSLHFMPEVLHFSQKYKVAVMDLAEMLVPEIMPTEYSMKLFLENMKAIIEDLKADNIYLAGTILGGSLAIYYIAKYPGKITKLALVAIPLKGYYIEHPERKKQTDQFWAAAFQSPSWGWKIFQEEILKAYPFQDYRRANEFIQRTKAFAKISNQTIPPEIQLIYYRILSEADVRPLLGKIRIPTLILHGEKDFLPLADVKYLNKSIRGSKLSIFKDGTFITLTEAKKTNKLLEEFFAD